MDSTASIARKDVNVRTTVNVVLVTAYANADPVGRGHIVLKVSSSDVFCNSYTIDSTFLVILVWFSVCPEGYFGDSCMEACKCRENFVCHPVEGCVCRHGYTGSLEFTIIRKVTCSP